ncbi:MAG TPA: amino acid transporter, partial [Bryobacterales bacterium]|nr:amino acid transporter [Bryobacterales bacterium]
MPQTATTTEAVLAGLALGGGLIVAIGAQNAFILRQGLARSHVFVLCLICTLSDMLLIAAGIAGLGTLLSGRPFMLAVVRYAGAAFLAVYGLLALRRALHPGILRPAGEEMPLKRAILTVLAFTFLNPHVYLDTVVLIGALSTQYGAARRAFGAGAGLA